MFALDGEIRVIKEQRYFNKLPIKFIFIALRFLFAKVKVNIFTTLFYTLLPRSMQKAESLSSLLKSLNTYNF